jgi:peptide deformylase
MDCVEDGDVFCSDAQQDAGMLTDIQDLSRDTLPILIVGDPRLEKTAQEVRPHDANLPTEIGLMHGTLAHFRWKHGYGRGLAAPQVGIDKRIIVLNLGAKPFALINPEITWRSDELFEVWDDCLSVPDRVVRVRRHRSVSLRYFDERWRRRNWNRLPADLAELIQHEVDHLQGILMLKCAWGPNAIRPIEEHEQLVGAGRPKHRLSLERIANAAAGIDPVFLHSAQFECDALNDALGCRVTLKVETANPIRSFKGRGADFFLQQAIGRGDERPIVCASAGNFGQALAYTGRTRGRDIVVYAAHSANPLKVDRMRRLGADVRLAGHDFDAAKAEARRFAAEEGAWFVEDGREPEISEGAGSIAVELLRTDAAFDHILLPVGNGALINGNARWIEASSPATRVVGVCAAGADCMRRSFERGTPVETAAMSTIADGIGVRVPVPEAVADMQGIVDEIKTVTDDQILEAMRLLFSSTGLPVEPAGAAGLAAVVASRGDFADSHVALLLCGGNLTEKQIREWLVC